MEFLLTVQSTPTAFADRHIGARRQADVDTMLKAIGYEALAVGPTLPDGRRLVFVTSDDNGSATQVARVLSLLADLREGDVHEQ